MGIEFIDHTADVAVRISASDLTEIVKLAVVAEGLALIGEWDGSTRLVERGDRFGVKVSADGPDFTSALVSLLNDLLFLVEEKGAIPVDFEVGEIHITSERAEISGTVILDDGWRPAEELKAVSYGLRWEILLIFDV